MNASLNAARRLRDIDAAAQEVTDVLVVGLGATGAGVALDAASRGLSVVAIDAHDLAFGTSRWSSKLIHGGLRYLARGQVGVARESAVERGHLMTRTAPHLVRALPFVLPLTPLVSGFQERLARTGFRAGDLLRASARTPRAVLPRPRSITGVEALRLAPGLRAQGLRGGLLSWDGQLEDDARLVVALARTAAAHGARVITRCRAVSLYGSGALVLDEITGSSMEIKARAVINATGVWAGGLVPSVSLRPSRGTHVVLRTETLGGLGAGLQVPVPGETNRFVIVLPQHGNRTLVGLTDEPVDGPIPDVPVPSEPEIGFLLDVLGSVLDAPVGRSDVVGAYAGLRPLLEASGRTADISRKHAVLTSPEGVVTIVGGKLTTYRRMAADAVSAAISARGLTAARSRTDRLPLVGAAAAAELARLSAPRRLVQRYGTEAPAVAAIGAAEPALSDPIGACTAITGAELAFALAHEGALDVSDLLDRRTRIGLVPADRDAVLAAAQAVVDRFA